MNIQKNAPSFELYLQEEFKKRCSADARYSLRTFAAALDTDVSQLSKIMRARRPPSESIISKFGMLLGLPSEEILEFQKISKIRKKFPKVDSSRLKYEPISDDTIKCLADYRHSLTIELMKLDHFQWDIKWLAGVLKCHQNEAQEIVDRLKKTGLLITDEKGELVHSNWSISFRPDENLTSIARRENQEGFLNLAVKALHNVPIEKRDQSSMTMATNQTKIQEAKKRITDFRRELCAFLEDTESKDSVYQLNLSLFPLAEVSG